jgi:hypothetical protein
MRITGGVGDAGGDDKRSGKVREGEGLSDGARIRERVGEWGGGREVGDLRGVARRRSERSRSCKMGWGRGGRSGGGVGRGSC